MGSSPYRNKRERKANHETQKAATLFETLPLLDIITYTDLKKYIFNIITHEWHKQWQQLNTKLNTVKNNIQV